MGFVTRCVAKLAVIETNALVRGVRFIAMPVTIRGRIAVQPIRRIVRRFSYCLVKSYPAIPAAIHSRLHLNITDVNEAHPYYVGLQLKLVREIMFAKSSSWFIWQFICLIFMTVVCLKCMCVMVGDELLFSIFVIVCRCPYQMTQVMIQVILTFAYSSIGRVIKSLNKTFPVPQFKGNDRQSLRDQDIISLCNFIIL